MLRTARFMLAGLLLCLSAVAVAADAPALLSFEGRLLRADGTPEAGYTTLTFRLYESQAGGADAWSETYNLMLGGSGYYAVHLGSLNALPSFDGRNWWLGVTVVGEAEMTPRTRLVSVPYALRATSASAADNSLRLEGLASTDFLRPGSTLDASKLSGTVPAGVSNIALLDSAGKLDASKLAGNVPADATNLPLLDAPGGKILATYMPAATGGGIQSGVGPPFACESTRRGSMYYDTVTDQFFGCFATPGWQRLARQAPPNVATAGLVAWWKFISDANDSWGGFNGTLQGTATVSVGGLNLPGGGSWVQVADNAALRPAALTLEAWLHPTAYNIAANVNAFLTKGSNEYLAYFRTATSNITFYSTCGSTADPTFPGAGTIALNQWVHIVLTYSAAQQVVYLDGVSKATHTPEGPPCTSGTGNLFIGTDSGGGATTQYFIGKMMDVRIYNRALTAVEAQLNYQAGRSGL